MDRILIDDSVSTDVTHDPRYSRGAEPRDYKVHPPEMFALPTDIPDVDPADYQARIEEQESRGSHLEAVWNRSGAKCLDQNGFNYCWAHSTVHGLMLQRVLNHEPYVPLSAVGLASIIKGGRNDGGWCGESAKLARSGVPSQRFWPQTSASRKYDTPQMRADMAGHRITADFTDLTRAVYDQDLTVRQINSLLLGDVPKPVPVDFNWWGHSVLVVRAVWQNGQVAWRILNSWYKAPGVPWGENGFATVAGNKMKPDQALGIVAASPAAETAA